MRIATEGKSGKSSTPKIDERDLDSVKDDAQKSEETVKGNKKDSDSSVATEMMVDCLEDLLSSNKTSRP